MYQVQLTEAVPGLNSGMDLQQKRACSARQSETLEAHIEILSDRQQREGQQATCGSRRRRNRFRPCLLRLLSLLLLPRAAARYASSVVCESSAGV